MYKSHPEGVVSVKFKEEAPAHECIRLMNGRFFGGQQIEAALWDGLTNYNVSYRVLLLLCLLEFPIPATMQ